MLIHPKSQNSQDARELAIARGKVMELENPEANVVCINQVETPKNSGQFIVGIQRAPTTTELQNTPV